MALPTDRAVALRAEPEVSAVPASIPSAWLYECDGMVRVSLSRVSSERDAFAGWAETPLYALGQDVRLNPCNSIFDHKWLSPSCVVDGCRSLNTRLLLDAINDIKPPDGFDAHTPSYNTGFARARQMAADLVRATLDPAVAEDNQESPL